MSNEPDALAYGVGGMVFRTKEEAILYSKHVTDPEWDPPVVILEPDVPRTMRVVKKTRRKPKHALIWSRGERVHPPDVSGKYSVFASGEGLLPPKEKEFLVIDTSFYPNLKLVTKIEEPETMHSVDLKPLQVGEVVGFEPLKGKVESTVGNPVVSYRYGKAYLRFRTQEEAKRYATAFCLESGLVTTPMRPELDLVSKVEECLGREANAALTWKDPNKDWVYVSGDGLLPDREYTPITVCYLYEIEAYHKGMRILRSSKDVGEATSGEEVKPTLSFEGKGGARFRTKEEAELWGGTKGKVEGSQEGLNSILVWEEDGVTYGSGKGLLPKGLDYSCVAVSSEPDYDNLSYMEDGRHIFFEPPKSWGKEGYPYRFATPEEAALVSPEGKFQPFEFEPNRVLVCGGEWKSTTGISPIYLSGSGLLPKVGYSIVAHRDLHQYLRDLADMRPRSTFDLGVNTGLFKGNVDLLKIRSYSPAGGIKDFRFGTREEAEFWVAQKNPEDRRIFTSPNEVNVYFKWGDEAEQNSKDGHHLPPKPQGIPLARIPGSDLVYPEPDEVLSKGTPTEVAYRVSKPSAGPSSCTFRTQEEAEFYSKWWGGGYSVEPTLDKVDAVMAWPLNGITLSETEYGGPICVSGYGLLPPNSWSGLPCSFFEQGGAYYGRVILCTEDDIARAKEKEATPPEPSEEAVCTDVAAKVDSAETSTPLADDPAVIAIPVDRPEESEIRSYVLTTDDPSVRQFNENKGALPVTFRLQTRELAELWQKTGSAISWSIEPSSLEPNSVLLWRTKGDVGYRASNDPIGRDSETLYPDQDAHSYALVRKSAIHLDQGSKYYRGLPVVYVPSGAPVEKEISLPLLGFLGALGLMHGVLKGASPSVKRVSVPKVPKAESEVVVESEVYESVAKGLRS